MKHAKLVELDREGRNGRIPRTSKFPRDWPSTGPIDLSIHDLPHASSTTEWWYMNGHCVVDDGREFSFFAAFFRQLKQRHPKTNEPEYAYSLTWRFRTWRPSAVSTFLE